MKVVLGILLAFFAGTGISVHAAEKPKFVQSFNVRSPASLGFTTGFMLNKGMTYSEWPGDTIPSEPEFMLSRTALAFESERKHSFEAYQLWISFGKAISIALLMASIIGGALFMKRGLKK